MDRLARFFFPQAVATALMFAILGVALLVAPVVADDDPIQPPGTNPVGVGPCSDTACSGPSTCDGDNRCVDKLGCNSCAKADATDLPDADVCACDFTYDPD